MTAASLPALSLPSSAQAELFSAVEETRRIGWSEGKPHVQGTTRSSKTCVRVLDAGRQGMVTAHDVTEAAVPALAHEALAMARVTPADECRAFAPSAATRPASLGDDKDLFKRSQRDWLDQFAALEKKILAIDPRLKKIIRFELREDRTRERVANTAGVNAERTQTSTTFLVEILAEEAQKTEVAWDYDARRFGKDCDVETVSRAAAEHAVKSLGAKPIASGSTAVVIHPRVGTQLLSLFAQALSAEAVERGRSFLRGKIGMPVASPAVTLVDDPLLPAGLASSPFDDEGTPRQLLTPVSGGRLVDFFYDIRSANAAKRASNGRAAKASIGAVPRPGATNFYMTPGNHSKDELLASHPRVFLVHDVMGFHMADPISGEFSLGASGFLYESGREAQPVRGVTIASSAESVFKNVAMVGNDLTWSGSFGCPSFLLPQMMVAGT